MLRRVISIVILFSLLLHFSSRTGFLAYIYAQRHALAHLAGAIREIPITECGSSYYGDSVVIADGDHEPGAIPAVLSSAHEIILFCGSVAASVQPEPVLITREWVGTYTTAAYAAPVPDFFQPPRG